MAIDERFHDFDNCPECGSDKVIRTNKSQKAIQRRSVPGIKVTSYLTCNKCKHKYDSVREYFEN